MAPNVGTSGSISTEQAALPPRNNHFGLFDQTDWRPDYYFMSDEFDDGSEKSREFLSHLEEKLKDVPYCFYNVIYYPDKYVRKAIGYKANVVRNVLAASRSSFWRKRNYYCRFSTNAARFVYDGSTCIQSVLQICYYMGFSEVYLLGTDCSMSGGRHHAAGADDTVADTKEAIEAEQRCYNNYIRDYDYLYRDMQRKHIPMKIYNATRGGSLEVFLRVKLEDSFG